MTTGWSVTIGTFKNPGMQLCGTAFPKKQQGRLSVYESNGASHRYYHHRRETFRRCMSTNAQRDKLYRGSSSKHSTAARMLRNRRSWYKLWRQNSRRYFSSKRQMCATGYRLATITDSRECPTEQRANFRRFAMHLLLRLGIYFQDLSNTTLEFVHLCIDLGILIVNIEKSELVSMSYWTGIHLRKPTYLYGFTGSATIIFFITRIFLLYIHGHKIVSLQFTLKSTNNTRPANSWLFVKNEHRGTRVNHHHHRSFVVRH